MTEKGKAPKSDVRRWQMHGLIQLALVVVFIGGAFLLSLYLSSLQTRPEPERGENNLELLVETDVVVPQSHRLRFDATGTVQVRAMTGIVPQVSGRVITIDDSAFPGGLFSPETVLFEIEKEDFELEIERLKAEVARAETRLQLQQARAETAVAEWRELNPETPVPPLVAEEPQLREARAGLDAAKAQLKTARLNLSRTEYQLPFAGRVTEFSIEEGQYVVAGQSYGQAYRLLSLEVDVPLEERKFQWLMATADPVIDVSSDSVNSEIYSAFVKRVAGKLDPQTRFARVVLGLNEAAPNLVPDVFVNVRFIGPEVQNVWVLPLDSLQENGIWVISPEETLHFLQPEIVQISGDTVVARSNGETIRVVRGDLPEATEGTPVRLGARTNGR